MPRSTKEWIGSSHDAKIPDYVRIRIWRRQKGDQDHAVCPLSALWLYDDTDKHLDHTKALIDGGEHRESNLAFVHPIAHRKKTAEEVDRRAKNDARTKSHARIGNERQSPLAVPHAVVKARAEARSKDRRGDRLPQHAQQNARRMPPGYVSAGDPR